MERSLVFAALLVGCGSTSTPSTFDASVDVTDEVPEFPGEDCGPTQFCSPPQVDAEAGPPVQLVDGGGPFTCHGCPCDGRTHYCDISSAGPPLPDPVDASCDVTPRCKPYPAACDGSPSCACIVACTCLRAPSGDGLLAGCVEL